MVMVWAGILAAGVAGKTPERPRQAEILVKGIDSDSDSLTVQMVSGDAFLDSFYLIDNDASGSEDNSAGVFWGDLELRVAGEKVSGNVVKVTSDGVSIPVENDSGDNTRWDITPGGDDFYITENVSFDVGDVLIIENIKPALSINDEVSIIWTPKDQTLFMEEV